MKYTVIQKKTRKVVNVFMQEKKVYSFRLTQDDVDKLDLLVEAEQERITHVIHEMRLDIEAKPISRTDIVQKLIQAKYDGLTND